jgi:hypothetical protein
MELTLQEKKSLQGRSVPVAGKPDGKEKSAITNEFISITGYKNREYALRLLNGPAQIHALLFVKGKTVKLRPAKPKLPNRKDKNLYR